MIRRVVVNDHNLPIDTVRCSHSRDRLKGPAKRLGTVMCANRNGDPHFLCARGGHSLNVFAIGDVANNEVSLVLASIGDSAATKLRNVKASEWTCRIPRTLSTCTIATGAPRTNAFRPQCRAADTLRTLQV